MGQYAACADSICNHSRLEECALVSVPVHCPETAYSQDKCAATHVVWHGTVHPASPRRTPQGGSMSAVQEVILRAVRVACGVCIIRRWCASQLRRCCKRSVLIADAGVLSAEAACNAAHLHWLDRLSERALPSQHGGLPGLAFAAAGVSFLGIPMFGALPPPSVCLIRARAAAAVVGAFSTEHGEVTPGPSPKLLGSLCFAQCPSSVYGRTHCAGIADGPCRAHALR
jgi:hypothetical protein